jgi:hypothetical protein
MFRNFIINLIAFLNASITKICDTFCILKVELHHLYDQLTEAFGLEDYNKKIGGYIHVIKYMYYSTKWAIERKIDDINFELKCNEKYYTKIDFIKESYSIIINFIKDSYSIIINFIKDSYSIIINFIKDSYSIIINFIKDSYSIIINFIKDSYFVLEIEIIGSYWINFINIWINKLKIKEFFNEIIEYLQEYLLKAKTNKIFNYFFEITESWYKFDWINHIKTSQFFNEIFYLLEKFYQIYHEIGIYLKDSRRNFTLIYYPQFLSFWENYFKYIEKTYIKELINFIKKTITIDNLIYILKICLDIIKKSVDITKKSIDIIKQSISIAKQNINYIINYIDNIIIFIFKEFTYYIELLKSIYVIYANIYWVFLDNIKLFYTIIYIFIRWILNIIYIFIEWILNIIYIFIEWILNIIYIFIEWILNIIYIFIEWILNIKLKLIILFKEWLSKALLEWADYYSDLINYIKDFSNLNIISIYCSVKTFIITIFFNININAIKIFNEPQLILWLKNGLNLYYFPIKWLLTELYILLYSYYYLLCSSVYAITKDIIEYISPYIIAAIAILNKIFFFFWPTLKSIFLFIYNFKSIIFAFKDIFYDQLLLPLGKYIYPILQKFIFFSLLPTIEQILGLIFSYGFLYALILFCVLVILRLEWYLNGNILILIFYYILYSYSVSKWWYILILLCWLVFLNNYYYYRIVIYFDIRHEYKKNLKQVNDLDAQSNAYMYRVRQRHEAVQMEIRKQKELYEKINEKIQQELNELPLLEGEILAEEYEKKRSARIIKFEEFFIQKYKKFIDFFKKFINFFVWIWYKIKNQILFPFLIIFYIIKPISKILIYYSLFPILILTVIFLILSIPLFYIIYIFYIIFKNIIPKKIKLIYSKFKLISEVFIKNILNKYTPLQIHFWNDFEFNNLRIFSLITVISNVTFSIIISSICIYIFQDFIYLNFYYTKLINLDFLASYYSSRFESFYMFHIYDYTHEYQFNKKIGYDQYCHKILKDSKFPKFMLERMNSEIVINLMEYKVPGSYDTVKNLIYKDNYYKLNFKNKELNYNLLKDVPKFIINYIIGIIHILPEMYEFIYHRVKTLPSSMFRF